METQTLNQKIKHFLTERKERKRREGHEEREDRTGEERKCRLMIGIYLFAPYLHC